MTSGRQFNKTNLLESSEFLHPAIPLVIYDDVEYDWKNNTLKKIPDASKKALKVVDEAIQLLNKIKKPVAVLSITGLYRSGKSYILSRILGSQDVFPIGHTMNAKTFGIWMATSVLECDDFSIVLLDSEGIDAANSSEECDIRILVLTVLLSSLFIYNSLSVPRKQDLDKMSMFLQLASDIAVKDDSENDVNDLRQYFPDFLWLLRDVHLLPTDEQGIQVSPTEYLKSKVLVRGKGFFESQSDIVARALITFFPSIECHTLPPPSSSAEVMRNICNKENELSQDFNDKVTEFLQYVKSAIQVKKGFKGGTVSGPILAHLTKEYISAINSPGAIPTISNAWHATTQLYERELIIELVKEYEADMEKAISSVEIPLEEESSNDEEGTSLMAFHRKILSQKIEKLADSMLLLSILPGDLKIRIEELENEIVTYDNVLVRDQEGQEWHKKIIIGGALFSFSSKNFQKSKKFCKDLINNLYQPIQDKVDCNDSNYTYDDLMSDINNLQSYYFINAKGPAKWEVYEKKRKRVEDDKATFTRLKNYEAELHKAAEEVEKVNKKALKMAEELSMLRDQKTRESEIHKAKIEKIKASHESALLKMKEDHLKWQKQVEKKIKEFEKAKMEDMIKAMQETKKEHDEDQQALIEQMQQQLREECHQNTPSTSEFDVLEDMPENTIPQHPPSCILQ